MAKPCQLAFSVMPHVEFGLFDGAFKVTQPLQILDYATVAMGSEGVRGRGKALGQQVFNFVNQAGAEVCFGTFVYALL